MKTTSTISLIIAMLMATVSLQAQTSKRGFSFQAYAVSPEGVALGDEGITAKFTIYPKSGSGFQYEESVGITTDAYGVFHTVVGNESPELFQQMDFTGKGSDYWMKVEVKKTVGGVFTTISDDAMLAVPYARHAANGVPVGTIVPFAGSKSKIPEGWLYCDGTEYDGASGEYTQLFNVIDLTWGGTGTLFKVPDLRGTFLRGLDDGANVDTEPARLLGSLQTDDNKSHGHPFSATTSTNGTHSHATNIGIWSRSFQGEDGSPKTAHQGASEVNTSSNGSHTHSVSGNSTAVGTESRPVNKAVLYIIKY